MKRKLYSTVEVAKAAGVLRTRLQNWIKTGKISAPRLRLHAGRAVRLWTVAQKNQIRQLGTASKPAPKIKFSQSMCMALAKMAATPNPIRRPARPVGRPRMDKKYGSAAILHEHGLTWRQVAEILDPDFTNDPDAAMERIRRGAKRVMSEITRRRP